MASLALHKIPVAPLVMTSTPFSALACPLDGEPLQQKEQSWRCTAGHAYDIARQGYVHLLPVQKKRSRDPGDSRDMVAARQSFLNAGHYAPIAAAVAELAFNGASPRSCLDAGCGEGYYLRTLGADADLALMGLDISKWAVVAAAKQDRPVPGQRAQSTRWVVASNANLPVLPSTLDCILCVFGFPVFPEFARVLAPQGRLILADAGADHLRELREIIYPSVKAQRELAGIPESFKRLAERSVRYTLKLPDQKTIQDLLMMTPHLYRASAEGRARAEALQQLSVTVDVTLRVLQVDKREVDDGISDA